MARAPKVAYSQGPWHGTHGMQGSIRIDDVPPRPRLTEFEINKSAAGPDAAAGPENLINLHESTARFTQASRAPGGVGSEY
jgi:hypothetical protein